jgi:hypothetical protein
MTRAPAAAGRNTKSVVARIKLLDAKYVAACPLSIRAIALKLI